MKTKKTFGRLSLGSCAAALFIFLGSCGTKDQIDFTNSDASNVEGEATSDSYALEAADISTDVVSAIPATLFGGRVDETVPATSFGDDARLKCAVVTITKTGTIDNPAGVITITFPQDGSCKDLRGNARKGVIRITYSGKKFALNSRLVTTFDGYSVGGVKVEGTFTLTNVTPTNGDYPKFTSTIVGGKVTFLEGKTVTREQAFTREWQRGANPLLDKWALLAGGTASGTNRDGKEYTMTVTKDLIYSRACQLSDKVFIAVSGEKTFTSGGKVVTINYGDGACDNKVTITISGKTTTVEVKGDGN